jgi:hypothetical protein
MKQKKQKPLTPAEISNLQAKEEKDFGLRRASLWEESP